LLLSWATTELASCRKDRVEKCARRNANAAQEAGVVNLKARTAKLEQQAALAIVNEEKKIIVK
jgi:hypothetical protein